MFLDLFILFYFNFFLFYVITIGIERLSSGRFELHGFYRHTFSSAKVYTVLYIIVKFTSTISDSIPTNFVKSSCK